MFPFDEVIMWKIRVFENMAAQMQHAYVQLKNTSNDIDGLKIQLCRLSILFFVTDVIA